jgi:hypothetical protein
VTLRRRTSADIGRKTLGLAVVASPVTTTLAQKAIALAALAVVDLAVFAVGGALLAFGALLATLPFTVTVTPRSA